MVAKKTAVAKRKKKPAIVGTRPSQTMGGAVGEFFRAIRTVDRSILGAERAAKAEEILFVAAYGFQIGASDTSDLRNSRAAIDRMYRALVGARPDDEDAAKIRRVDFWFKVSVGLKVGPELATERAALVKKWLSEIDAAFRALDQEALAAILARLDSGALKMTGAITEVLMLARALSVHKKSLRRDVQRRVTKALKPKRTA